MTREAWLEAAVLKLRGLLPPDLPRPPVKLSIYPPQAKRRGECWGPTHSLDSATLHIYISAELTDPPGVLCTLLHELIHAAVGTDAGHKGAFIQVARRAGFTGPPWTTSLAGPDLAVSLKELAGELGKYPHVGQVKKFKKKQTTRMRLWTCPCGETIRHAGQEPRAKCLKCEGVFEQKEV